MNWYIILLPNNDPWLLCNWLFSVPISGSDIRVFWTPFYGWKAISGPLRPLGLWKDHLTWVGPYVPYLLSSHGNNLVQLFSCIPCSNAPWLFLALALPPHPGLFPLYFTIWRAPFLTFKPVLKLLKLCGISRSPMLI